MTTVVSQCPASRRTRRPWSGRRGLAAVGSTLTLVLAPSLLAQTPAAPPTPANPPGQTTPAPPTVAPPATPPAPTPAPALGVIEGRVVDLRGEGVPAATLTVATWRQPDRVLARATADGSGYFRCSKVPLQEGLVVRAAAAGMCSNTSGRSSGTTTIPLQHAAKVHGILRNRDGEPVSGATVCARVRGRSLFGVRVLATTDDDGRFELVDAPLAPLFVSAWIDGEGLAMTLVQCSGDLAVDLRPNPDVKTTSLAIELEGLPPQDLAAVRVSLLPYLDGTLTYLPPPLDRPLLTSSRLQLDPVPNWQYVVSLTHPAWVLGPRSITLVPDQGPHVARFTATPKDATALTCKFLVQGDDQQPKAGVPFVLRASNGGQQTEGTSDAAGLLTLSSPLPAGTKAILRCTDDRWVTDQQRAADPLGSLLSLGQHACVVDAEHTEVIRLVPSSSVRGRVLLSDGRPAPFVSVQLEESSPNRMPQWSSFAYATSDRDGNFAFLGLHHCEQPIRVAIESPFGTFCSDSLDLSRVGSAVLVPPATLAPPAIVEGVLRDWQQRPVGGYRVWLRDWDLARGGQRSGSVVETLTDREGRYRFVGVPPGGAWLQLIEQVGKTSPDGKAVEPFEVQSGQTYQFDLQLPPP